MRSCRPSGVETRDQVQQGGLAGSRWPDQGDRVAGRTCERRGTDGEDPGGPVRRCAPASRPGTRIARHASSRPSRRRASRSRRRHVPRCGSRPGLPRPGRRVSRISVRGRVGRSLVELAGRLVGEEDRRVVGEGDGEPGAGQLAAGQLARPGGRPVADAEVLEQPRPALAGAPPARGCASATFASTSRCSMRFPVWNRTPMGAPGCRLVRLGAPAQAVARRS